MKRSNMPAALDCLRRALALSHALLEERHLDYAPPLLAAGAVPLEAPPGPWDPVSRRVKRGGHVTYRHPLRIGSTHYDLSRFPFIAPGDWVQVTPLRRTECGAVGMVRVDWADANGNALNWDLWALEIVSMAPVPAAPDADAMPRGGASCS